MTSHPDAARFQLDEQQLRTIRDSASAFNQVPAASQRDFVTLGFLGGCATLFVIFLIFKQWMPATALASFTMIAVVTRWFFHGVTGQSPLYQQFLQFLNGLGKTQWLATLLAVATLVIIVMATNLFGAALALILVAMAMVGTLHVTLDKQVAEQRQVPLENIRQLLAVLRQDDIDEFEQRRLVCVHSGVDWEPCFESLFGYEALLLARQQWSDDELGRRRRRRLQLRDWLIQRMASCTPPQAAETPTPEEPRSDDPTVPATSVPEVPATTPTKSRAMKLAVPEETTGTPTSPLAQPPSPSHIPVSTAVQNDRMQRWLGASLEQASRQDRLPWWAWRRTRFAVGAILVGLCLTWMWQNRLVRPEDVSGLAQKVVEAEDLANVRNAVTDMVDQVKSSSKDTRVLRLPGIPAAVAKYISGWPTGVAGIMLITCCFLPLPGLVLSSYASALVVMFADRWGIPDLGILKADVLSVGAGVAVLAVGVALAILRRTAEAILSGGTPQGRDVQLLNARGQVVHGRGAGRRTAGDVAISYLRSMLITARRTRASDIHLEPEGQAATIRMRVDGSMVEAATIDLTLCSRLLNLVKILCDLDISKRGIVQDGSFQAAMPHQQVDYRASFAPVAGSQKLVIRVLDTTAVPQNIDDLHMPPMIARRVRETCGRAAGMLLVCGPTGSGKTTTLYAALRVIDVAQRNVITIEDPVEYHLEGITQTSIDAGAGNSFHNLLRSSLRQDPDVILVGEIRDGDTARTAMRAAMAGHLVLSTLHANDAVSAVIRLMDLGADPNLLASSLQTVLVQHLVRALCPQCKVRRQPDPPFSGPGEKLLEQVFEPRGCSSCLGTGYQGRRALFEMLLIDDTMKEAICKSPTINDLRKTASGGQLMAMSQVAWQAVTDGITSMHEVDRVIGTGTWNR